MKGWRTDEISTDIDQISADLSFLPETPVALEPGDTAGVALRIDFTGDEYQWQWRTATLDEIAAAAVQAFPGRFKDRRAALAHAGELSLQYAR